MLNILNIKNGRGSADIDGNSVTLNQGLQWNGQVVKVLAGEALSRGDVVYPLLSSNPTGEWKKANAAVGTALAGFGYVLVGCADEGQALILLDGYVKNTDENYGTNASKVLVIAEPPTATDTLSIDGTVFEFVADADDMLATSDYAVVFSDEATAKTAFVAAVTQAIADNAVRVTVASAFSGDNLTITSALKGYAGNAIVLAEAMTHGSNIWTGGATALSGGVEGGILYMGEGSGGELTLTAPGTTNDIIQFMGYAMDAETFLFRPTVDYTLSS